MTDLNSIIPLAILGLCALNAFLLILVLVKKSGSDNSRLKEKLESYEKELKDEFKRNRQESATNSFSARKETMDTLMSFQTSINNTLNTRFDSLTNTTQNSLKNLQDGNEKKLEQMRLTVDEKLQSTLEKRLSSSFEIVGKQLEAVQKGLGEMQSLANDVGGLKRVLTNVKTAGGMGEIQLESLLYQVLSPEQYEKNAHPNPSKPARVVEFAVKIPAKETGRGYLYLPVDSKYPAEVWDKLTLAYQRGEKTDIEGYRKALVTDIKKFAKDIKEKYIEEPYTTNFGVMFLPFEGLYSEVTRIPGLFQLLQDEYKVTVTGPTTLNAFLNSLQMGFRTLAIQKETSRVWELLNNVRTEFGKFGDVLTATKRKLEQATGEIEKAEVRTRAIHRKLNMMDSISNPNVKDDVFFLDERDESLSED